MSATEQAREWRVFDVTNSNRSASWIAAPDEETAIEFFLALGHAKTRDGIRSVTDITATWQQDRRKAPGLADLFSRMKRPAWLCIGVDGRPERAATLTASGDILNPRTGTTRPARTPRLETTR